MSKKNILSVIIIFGITLIMQGCMLNSLVGSGYSITIKSKEIDMKEVSLIQERIKQEHYELKKQLQVDNEYIYYYGTNSVLIICSYQIDNKTLQYKNLRVMIHNDAVGQNPSVMKEIDRVGDILYAELLICYGKNNVSINKERTGLGI